jgi:hypothetical protein
LTLSTDNAGTVRRPGVTVKGNTMPEKTILMLRDKIVAGRSVREGETITCSARDADYLISRKAAIASEKPKPKAKAKKSPVNKMDQADETR